MVTRYLMLLAFLTQYVVTASLIPSPSQLAWLDDEVGALLQFNIGEYGTLENDYACGNPKLPPVPASRFNPSGLNTTAWMQSVRDAGMKYAVLTAQAGCGFLLWPTNTKLPDGSLYNYTVRESPFKRDLVGEFVAAARSMGVKPGIYYIVNNNFFLSYKQGVQNVTAPSGQVQVTSAEYRSIVLAQLRELWANYGDLVELWFDGGTADKQLIAPLAALLEELQPDAVRFQGPSKLQAVRWVGSESGVAPGAPPLSPPVAPYVPRVITISVTTRSVAPSVASSVAPSAAPLSLPLTALLQSPIGSQLHPARITALVSQMHQAGGSSWPLLRRMSH